MLLLQRQEELRSCWRVPNDEGVLSVAATSVSIEEPDRDDGFLK